MKKRLLTACFLPLMFTFSETFSLVLDISGLCDGCSPGIIEMYQNYIDGRKELREINAEFQARYMSGAEGPERSGCVMGE